MMPGRVTVTPNRDGWITPLAAVTGKKELEQWEINKWKTRSRPTRAASSVSGVFRWG